MAVKPCGVTYFSPLRGARDSVTTGMFLSDDMVLERREILLSSGHRLGAHVIWRRPLPKPRNRLGFAVDLELLVLEFNMADQLFTIMPYKSLVHRQARARGAIGKLLDQLLRHFDSDVRVDLRHPPVATFLKVRLRHSLEANHALDVPLTFWRHDAQSVDDEL